MKRYKEFFGGDGTGIELVYTAFPHRGEE